MALVVELGQGGATSDAYVDEAYVTGYAAKFGLIFPGAADAAAQEIAVRKGTQYIDIAYEPRTRGIRHSNTQALAWPRTSVEDRDGYFLATNTIPDEVKEATAEAAIKSLAGEDLLPDLAEPGAITGKSVQVGPISISTQWSGAGKSQVKYYRMIDLLLARWLGSSNVLVRA